jgi:hypothetical protein
MALGSTQSLVKMSTGNTSGGKSGRCVRLTTSPRWRAECHGFWQPKSPGTLWSTPELIRDDFTFYYQYKNFEVHIFSVNNTKGNSVTKHIIWFKNTYTYFTVMRQSRERSSKNKISINSVHESNETTTRHGYISINWLYFSLLHFDHDSTMCYRSLFISVGRHLNIFIR